VYDGRPVFISAGSVRVECNALAVATEGSLDEWRPSSPPPADMAVALRRADRVVRDRDVILSISIDTTLWNGRCCFDQW
jgi:hypothetical protein